MNDVEVWKGTSERERGSTHLPELRHEPRIPEDLQLHHLRVLLDRPAARQNALHRTHFSRKLEAENTASVPAGLYDIDIPLDQEHHPSPTPRWAVLAFWSCKSRPSSEPYGRLCSMTGFPEFNGSVHERVRRKEVAGESREGGRKTEGSVGERTSASRRAMTFSSSIAGSISISTVNVPPRSVANVSSIPRSLIKDQVE